MTIFKIGDMWDRFGEVDLFCITINGMFKADGELIMGAGIALAASKIIPGLKKAAGYQIRTHHELKPHELPTLWIGEKGQTLGLFQVKHHFGMKASKELIKRSTIQLFRYIVRNPEMTVCLNFPGIGLGRLKRNEVFPIIELLPNNVEVWEYNGAKYQS